jgi:hypothetical protein
MYVHMRTKTRIHLYRDGLGKALGQAMANTCLVQRFTWHLSRICMAQECFPAKHVRLLLRSHEACAPDSRGAGAHAAAADL